MSRVGELKKAENLSDLAKLLGYQPKTLSFILYKIPNARKYITFTIPKSDGGEREIKAPAPRLKELQRRLASLLEDSLEEVFGHDTYGRTLSHGFRRSHSIITNANNHKNKRYVFNIDLKDFFPSINFGRVRGFFIKSNQFQLNPKVATLIAQIACHDNSLPQGSPTSPVISNLIGHVLDVRLVKLAKKAKCKYSRYADDITFSTREKGFSALIAKKERNGQWCPSGETHTDESVPIRRELGVVDWIKGSIRLTLSTSDRLNTIIERSGFEINHNKTSMQYNTNKQTVTGLVVNKKVNINASYYRQSRAMCDALFRTGEFYIGKEMRWGSSKDSPEKEIGSISQLRGVLSFIYYVKKHHDERDIKERWKHPTAIHKLYNRFLYFDKFHALKRPVVICEGSTDGIYIKCALKNLSQLYPKLIDASQDTVRYLLDFFKHSAMNMDLMQFSGGTGDLASFIHHYETRMQRYLCEGRKFPVIILVDNDKGANPVFEKAGSVVGHKVDGAANFYYLTENLYLVPKPNNVAEVKIEDLFENAVTSVVLGGKTFNPDQKSFDKDKHYGKQIFAEAIVKPNQGTINFDGFKPLLGRLEAAIADYEGKLASP